MNNLTKTALVSEWLCDKCGELIIKPTEGYLEWFTPVDEPLVNNEQGFMILHDDCKHDSHRMFKRGKSLSSRPLHEANTNADLEDLLEHLEGERCKDKDELIEIIKRLHVAGYEANRIKEIKEGY